jgi:hypothetical protein
MESGLKTTMFSGKTIYVLGSLPLSEGIFISMENIC